MTADTMALRPSVGGTRVALSPEQIARVHEVLKEHPELTDSQVALQAKVSRQMVWKLRRDQENEDGISAGSADEAQAVLARLIGEHLPLMERVRLLAGIARDRKAPGSVRLKAFELANEYQGMLTRKQQRDAEANSTAPGPIFVFSALSLPSAAPIQVVVEAEAATVPPSAPDKSTT